MFWSSKLNFLVLTVVSGSNIVRSQDSFCYVLHHLSEYENKTVVIRAEVFTGREAFSLRDSQCVEGPKTGDYTWHPFIWIAPFQPDSNHDVGRMQFDNFWQDVEKISKVHNNIRIEATITGRIRSRPDLGGVKSAQGKWLLNGFGFKNHYPAEIYPDAIENWTVSSKPKTENESKNQ